MLRPVNSLRFYPIDKLTSQLACYRFMYSDRGHKTPELEAEDFCSSWYNKRYEFPGDLSCFPIPTLSMETVQVDILCGGYAISGTAAPSLGVPCFYGKQQQAALSGRRHYP